MKAVRNSKMFNHEAGRQADKMFMDFGSRKDMNPCVYALYDFWYIVTPAHVIRQTVCRLKCVNEAQGTCRNFLATVDHRIVQAGILSTGNDVFVNNNSFSSVTNIWRAAGVSCEPNFAFGTIYTDIVFIVLASTCRFIYLLAVKKWMINHFLQLSPASLFGTSCYEKKLFDLTAN